MARGAAWIALVVVGVLGDEAPPFTSAVVAVAGSIAILAFASTVLSIWRGPPIVAFELHDGQECDEQDAEPVRAYAQLRGTIGGAGHVHPARLVLPAVAWAAALLAGLRCIVGGALESAGITPVIVAIAAAVGAWLFPSRPYWYREVMGGGAVVAPPEAVAELVAREMNEDEPGIAAVHEAGRAAPILRDCSADSGAARIAQESSGARRERRERLALEAASAVIVADAVRGREGAATKRSPRYTVRRSLVVERDGSEIEVATLNVSDGGLAVRWTGELPVVGDDLVVKLEDGLFTRGVDAVVCWHAAGAGRDRTVGIRVRAEGRAARLWRELVEAAARSGAQTA